MGWLATAAAALGAWWGTLGQLEQSAYAELNRVASIEVEQYYATIQSELARYERIPDMLRADPDVVAFLKAPSAHTRERINAKLDAINRQVQGHGLYMASPQGRVLAASGRRDAINPMGEDGRASELLADAMVVGHDRPHATASVRGGSRVFFSQKIEADGELLGVSLLQADLGTIETSWWPGAQRAVLLDRDNVVIISSTRQWKDNVLQPPSFDFGPHVSTAASDVEGRAKNVLLQASRQLDNGGWVLSIRTPTPHGTEPVEFVARMLTMPSTGWTVVALIETTTALRAAHNAAIAVGLAVAFLGVVIFYLQARRQISRHEQAEHDALENAYAQLEDRIQEKTAELRAANSVLQAEVAERKIAQQELIETQDQLVQAGKLATLGQMAAGISHELNQPLHALYQRCSNAVQYNTRKDHEGVARNLAAMGELCERMDHITSQLRGFARKDCVKLEAVSLSLAVDKAVDILSSKLSECNARISVRIPRDISVMCDAHRLEQVFVNLIANAIDATQAVERPLVEVIGERTDSGILVKVVDNGPGIGADAMTRLFEPFFTSKPAGEGLGLGLVISASILRAFGSTLRASNSPQGGAEFEFRLDEVRHG